MIFAYPDPVCVTSGDLPEFQVTGDASGAAVQYFRWGENRELVKNTARGGVHIAAFGDDVTPASLDGRSARALFVVRNAGSRARLLVMLPLFTYHAYNVAEVDGTLGEDEGACLYSGAPWVSLLRPGGGIGGHPWDEVNADAYDPASPRQTFAHWDGKALAWLEQNGIAYDCCTDLELHEGCIDLHAYRALASFGHHEYWTDAMRLRVERFVAQGGNAAFFGGNTCWFRTEYDAQRRAIHRIGRWTENPEWRFTGVTYGHGGGKWIGARPATGYTVADPDHWVFSGTNLRAGEVFGAPERLIGYECDGAPPESGVRVVASASIADWPVDDGSGERSQTARADMGVRECGGTIFTASTADWARVLASEEPAVARVTRNVIERFTA